MRKALHLAALLLALTSSYSAGAAWYVNSAATGNNDGRSAANAWRSASNIAYSSLRPGDVVYWHSGNGSSYGNVSVGASGNAASVGGRIWFIGTGPTLPKLSSIDANGRDYVAFVNFEITGGSGAAVSLSGDTGWLLQDLYIHHKSTAFSLDRNANNTRNIIRNCTISQMNITEFQNEIGGSYNVMEYCRMDKGGDRLTNFSHHLVYRNHFFSTMSNSDLGSAEDPHIDDIQTWSAGSHTLWTDKVVMEGIFSRDSTTRNAHFHQLRNEDGRGNLRGLICRFNVGYNIGGLGHVQNFDDIWYYNNTFVDLANSNNYAINFDNSTGTFINNSFTRANGDAGIQAIYGQNGASLTQSHNHEYQSGVLGGTSNLQNVDPRFTNGAALNFMPQADSQLVGNARYQTQANGSGSNSTSLSVDVADWFIDGWGLVEGDKIKIGSADWVRISAINYSAKTITLAASRTWSDNAQVVLFGTQAIGAYEYRSGGYTLSGTIANSGNTYTVTPNNNDLCRMVIFYQDGVPQAPDYDAPFQYTSSGGTVTAQLYARFASQSPVVAAVPGGNPPSSGSPAAPSGLEGNP